MTTNWTNKSEHWNCTFFTLQYNFLFCFGFGKYFITSGTLQILMLQVHNIFKIPKSGFFLWSNVSQMGVWPFSLFHWIYLILAFTVRKIHVDPTAGTSCTAVLNRACGLHVAEFQNIKSSSGKVTNTQSLHITYETIHTIHIRNNPQKNICMYQSKTIR